MTAGRIVALVGSLAALVCSAGLLAGTEDDAHSLDLLSYKIGSPNPPTFAHAPRSAAWTLGLLTALSLTYVGFSVATYAANPPRLHRITLVATGLLFLLAGVIYYSTGHEFGFVLYRMGGSSDTPLFIDLDGPTRQATIALIAGNLALAAACLGLVLESLAWLREHCQEPSFLSARLRPYFSLIAVVAICAIAPMLLFRWMPAHDLAAYMERWQTDSVPPRPSYIAGCMVGVFDGMRLTGIVFLAIAAIQLLGVARATWLLNEPPPSISET